jgi:hypothetical protein
MSKTKEQTEEVTKATTETAPTSLTDQVLEQLKTLNDTLFRCGQLLSSIDDRLSPRKQYVPSPAARADANRPLSNQPQWSNNVAGGWQ